MYGHVNMAEKEKNWNRTEFLQTSGLLNVYLSNSAAKVVCSQFVEKKSAVLKDCTLNQTKLREIQWPAAVPQIYLRYEIKHQCTWTNKKIKIKIGIYVVPFGRLQKHIVFVISH